ncbi:hypothetical protein DFQ29_003617 [Apophysomyces sp. BC1021]|nr:hypothetical protein DFQ29_003617 [Apophysomyces sp. BC1021]
MDISKSIRKSIGNATYEQLQEIRLKIRTTQETLLKMEEKLKKAYRKRYSFNKVMRDLEKKTKVKPKASEKKKLPDKAVVTEGNITPMLSAARQLFERGSVPVCGVDPGIQTAAATSITSLQRVVVVIR